MGKYHFVLMAGISASIIGVEMLARDHNGKVGQWL